MLRQGARRGRIRLLIPAMAFALALSVPLERPAQAMDDLQFRVPGASADLRADLEASSLLMTAQRERQLDPLDITAAARAEYGRLIGLLYEHGYYAPRISVRIDGREAAGISSLAVPRSIGRVEVDIELGPQFRFGRTRIAPLAPDTTLPEGFAAGAEARSTVVREAATAGLDGWRARGHALAAIDGQQVTADHARQELHVDVRLAPGPQLRFGALRPQGQEATRPDRISAIAGLERGALYDPDAVIRAEARLRRTGSFNSVALRTAPVPNPDGSIDIDALIEEAPPRRLGFGAELDTESGLRLTAFWLHRNLFGGAERLRLEAAIDGIASPSRGIGYSFDARYVRPSTFQRDTDLEIGLRLVRLDERDYLADAIEADIRLLRRFSDRLSGSAGFALRHEYSQFGPGRALSATYGTAAVPLSLTYDRRDRPLDATRGYFLTAEAMPYLGFSSASSGVRFRFDGRAYNDLGSDGRYVFALRAQAGAIFGGAINTIPREFLFYSGGGGTVRGLPYQSLGVTEGGVDSGGRGFAALSGEARMRINDRFSLVAFADVGFVSSGPFSGASDWHAGAGGGIRYQTPIGPMRFDVGMPLRRNASLPTSPIQFYLGIGQAF